MNLTNSACTFLVPWSSQINSATKGQPPNDRPLYVGGEIFVFENNETKGTYLSNNYVLIPHHSWYGTNEMLVEELYVEEAADLAVVKCADEKPSLHPANMYYLPPNGADGTVCFNLVTKNGNNPIFGFRKVDELVYMFHFENELESGESGTLIMGTTQLEKKDNPKQFDVVDSPLFMVIARWIDDAKFGLAIYLPLVLSYIRHKPFHPRMVKPTVADSVEMTPWYLITIPGQIKLIALGLKSKMDECFQARKAVGTSVDASVLKHIEAKKASKGNGYLQKLYYGYCVATDNGPYKHSTCWVIDHELQCSTSTGYYQLVGKAMREAGIQNATFFIDGSADTYTGSNTIISIDNIVPYSVGTPFICHHPFFCEVNTFCRGAKVDKDGKSIITHCCIRPSHLVGLNQNFNTLGRVLQSHVSDTSKKFKYKNTTVTW